MSIKITIIRYVIMTWDIHWNFAAVIAVWKIVNIPIIAKQVFGTKLLYGEL